MKNRLTKIMILIPSLLLWQGVSGQYCAGGPSSNLDSNIETVNITGENGSSISYTGCPAIAGIEDQTSLTVDLTAGNTYTLDVQFGTCGGNYGGTGEAWIDFNQNQTFEPSESIGTSSGIPGTAPWDGIVSFTFTAPVVSLAGVTRIRVMQEEGSNPAPLDPCGAYTWGSVVDFTANINGTYCSGGPASTADSNIESVNITGENSSSISYIGCPGLAGVEDQTALTVDLNAGDTYTLDVQFGTCGGNYAGGGEAWIDFNQNQIFEASESIGQSSGTPGTAPWDGVVSFTFNVSVFSTAGTTRIRVMQEEGFNPLPLDPCGAYTWGSAVDFTADIAVPPITCPYPSNLASSSISGTGVTIDWTENGAATQWNVEWGASGFTPGTGTQVGADNGNTTQTSVLTGLTPITTYDVYVQADCGVTDQSLWVGPITITTLCVTYTAPWSEDFSNGGTIPNCWTQGISNGESWLFANTTGNNHIGSDGTLNGTTASGDYFAWVDDSQPASLGTSLLSPMIDVSALTSPMLRFFLISDNEGNTNVDFSVDVWDGAAWNIAMYTSNSNTMNNAWEEIDVDLNTLTITGDVQIRFVVDENNGFDFYDDVAIDDVEIRETPSCLKPVSLVANNITSLGVDLGWTEANGATTWNIEYGTPGFTPGAGAGTAESGVTSNPYAISGLTSFTTYEFYVQTVCGPGDISDWAGPFSFTTLCAPYTAPFYEGFNNGVQPPCWENLSSDAGTNVNAFWEFNGAAAFGASNNGRPGGTYAYSDGSVPSPDSVMLLTPLIDLSPLTSPELSFEWFSNNTNNPGDNTPLILEIFDGTSWNDLDTLIGDNAAWLNVFYDLSPYAGNTIQVRFMTNQTIIANGSFYNDILIDEVRVDEMTTCLPPSNLAVANITSTSADLSWTENNTATNWNIEFGLPGFTIGSGTPAPNVSSNPYTLGGLTPNTTYDFYVQSACGPSDQSAWFGPFEFTTECASVIAPWSEDFTNGGNIPSCWEQGPFNGEDWNFDNNPPFFGHIGNAGTLNGTTASGDYFAWVDDSAPHNIGTSMLSPMIDVSALTIPMLSFYLISDNEGATNVNFYVDIWDGTAWNIGAFTSNSNTVGGWEEIIVPLNILNITGDIQLRFAVDELNGGDINDDVAIDDVSVYDAPICNAPSALTATNITANQADLTWTGNGSATIWNIEYGITGFALGNGQPDNGVTNPYTITGLSLNTTYDFYVQSDCGLNQSTWEGPFTFTTPCITANGTDTQVACNTYTWIDGMTYTADNNTAMYTIVGGAANGCDSIVSLDLTVNSSVTGTDTQLGCDAYTWIDGMTYTADNNTAMFTIVGGAASGCDSTVTLDLTIEPSNNAGIDNLSLVCMNQPVDLDTLLDSGADAGGTWFDPSGSPLSSTLITAPSVVSAYDYTYEVSSPDCPTSVAEITLVVNGGCDYLSITGEVMTDISVYPNPTTSVLTILNPSNTSSLKVEMLDMNGRIVLVENKALNNATEATLAIDYLERGIYTLRVYNSEGQKTFKIVKQ